jgi:hypothetical protein
LIISRRILAAPVPADDRSGGEAVAQIMGARAATVTAISLKIAQADALARQREVAARVVLKRLNYLVGA